MDTLPRIKLNNEVFVIDERLEEIRSVSRPWKRLAFNQLNSCQASKVWDKLAERQ